MLTQLRRFLSILKCWIRIRILRNVFRFQNRNKKYKTPNEKSIASRKKHPRRPILLLPLQVTNVSCRFTWYATPSRWAALGWVRWYWSINHELHEAQLLKINCSSALEALHYSTESISPTTMAHFKTSNAMYIVVSCCIIQNVRHWIWNEQLWSKLGAIIPLSSLRWSLS